MINVLLCWKGERASSRAGWGHEDSGFYVEEVENVSLDSVDTSYSFPTDEVEALQSPGLRLFEKRRVLFRE